MTTEQKLCLNKIIQQRIIINNELLELADEIEDTGDTSQLAKIGEKDIEITTTLLYIAKS